MRKYLIVGFIITFLGFIVWKYSTMFSEINHVKSSELPSSKSFLPEDSTFFSPLFFSQINVDEIYLSNFRPPVGFYYFQNKFHLIKCKIPVPSKKDLQTILKTEKPGSTKSKDVVYKTIFHETFSFDYMAKPQNISGGQILLGINGDSTVILQNDSNIYFLNTRLKNLSLRYSNNDPYDVIVNTNKVKFNRNAVYTQVLIIRKNNDYFLCMLFSDHDQLPSNLLKSLINL